jgi:hypothetical protein
MFFPELLSKYGVIMKKGNAVDSKSFPITLSVQAIRMLEEIAKNGIWGRNASEVAGRFVDRALEAFVEQQKVKLPEIKLRTRRK